MPSTKEIEEIAEEIKDYVNKLGDSVLEELAKDEEEGKDIICEHGGRLYHISIFSEERYVNIVYTFDIIPSLAAERPIQGLGYQQALKNSQEDGTNAEENSAEINSEAVKTIEIDAKDGEEKLKEVSKDKMEDISSALVERLSSTDTSYQLLKEEDTYIRGFIIRRKIFPFDDKLTLTEFNRSVQAVISMGVLGTSFLTRVFGFKGEVEEESDEEQDQPYIG